MVGLQGAKQTSKPAWAGLRSSPYGSKAKGLTFEKHVAKALPRARRGLWFSFHDANGSGLCSPDLVWDLGHEAVIFECKLTDTAQAYSQLKDLYLPVVSLAWQKPCRGVVVVKNLTPRSNLTLLARSFREAMDKSHLGTPLLHLPRPTLITPWP